MNQFVKATFKRLHTDVGPKQLANSIGAALSSFEFPYRYSIDVEPKDITCLLDRHLYQARFMFNGTDRMQPIGIQVYKHRVEMRYILNTRKINVHSLAAIARTVSGNAYPYEVEVY